MNNTEEYTTHGITQMVTAKKKLPEEWEWKKLGDLYEIKSGKRVHKKDWRNNGVPFYRAREIVKLSQNGFVNNELFISRDMYEKYKEITGVPKKGDIIVSAVGTLGKCYLVKKKDEFYFKDASVLWFEKKDNCINSNYTMHALNSEYIIKQIMHGSMGATVGTLTISRAKNIQIPLPPLSEQKRIVAILDEAFTAIDKARANMENNMDNAKELFDSYLNGIFSNPGEDWEEKKLGDICRIKHGFAFKSKMFEIATNVNLPIVLTPGNFTEEGSLEFVPRKTKRYLGDYPSEFRLNVGDLVVVMTDLSSKMKILGKPAIIKNNNLLHNQRIGKFIFIEKLSKEFVRYFLLTKGYLDKIKSTATGTMVKHTAPKRVLECRLKLPDAYSQKRIVAQLDKLSAETKHFGKIYQQKIASMDELKKSLMKKAFEGKL